MAHLSIAIIKTMSADSLVEEPKFDYLVLKTASGDFKFFDFQAKKNVIGDVFDYSSFNDKIVDFLFPNSNFNKEEIALKLDGQFFKSNKHSPHATVYEYTISNDLSIQLKKTKISDEAAWINEKQLLGKKKKWIKNQLFIFNKESDFNPPSFSKSIRESLKNIVSARDNGKLVVFTGAGVSIDSGLPSWHDIINGLKLDSTSIENEVMNVPQIYYDKRGKKEYHEKVRSLFKEGRTRFNPIHKQILDLRPLHIVSTNYDNHFEQIISESGSKYSIIKKDSDLPYSSGMSLCIKMHGDLAERNYILKKSDYDNYSKNFPLIESFVKGIFASKLVLFVGFSFSDPNLEHIVSFVSNILGEDNQRPYMISIPKEKGNKQESLIRTLEEKGVKVVEYEKEPLNDYFEQTKSKYDIESLDKLSNRGKEVYKFLKVINEFDPFSDTLDNLIIDNQLTSSVLRFKGFGSVPPKVFEKISPFKLRNSTSSENSTNASYQYYNPFHLETLNEKLLTFLGGRMNPKGDINILLDSNVTATEKERDLTSALQLLYDSGIRVISRKNDTTPQKIKLNPQNNDTICSCSRCLLERYEFDVLLEDLTTLSVKALCKSPGQDISLVHAYGFFKTGQISKAYFLLEELKNKSWREQNYITYFICLYNQSNMYRFLWSLDDSTLPENEFEEIRSTVLSIDLDISIARLPIDSAVRMALTNLKDSSLEKFANNSIKDDHEQIVELFNGYQREGYRSMGPYYWYKVETRFFEVWNFYHKNFLFNDEFLGFTELADLYLESMIVSYATSDRYEQRMKHFSSFFVHAFVHFGDPKKLQKTIETYGIKEFVFEDNETLNELLEHFNSFTRSGLVKNEFNDDVYSNSRYINQIDGSTYFENKIRKQFNSFLLLFSNIELSEIQINELLPKAIDYLSVNHILGFADSTKFLVHFIKQFISIVNEANTIKILEYSLSPDIWSDDIIAPVCGAILNVQKSKEFLNDEFLELIFDRTKESKKHSVQLEAMIPFYCLLEKQSQIKFKSKIVQTLTSNQLFSKTYYWGLWTPVEDGKVFKLFTNSLAKKCGKMTDFKINQEGFPVGIKDFQVWNDLMFLVDLTYSYDLFQDKNVLNIFNKLKSKMFRWVLQPKDFNYSSFNVNWLLAFDIRIRKKLESNPQIEEAVIQENSENYNSRIAKIFFQDLLS